MPEGFIRPSDVHNELKKEKIFLQGVDKRGCPIGVIIANRHYGSDCDLEELESNSLLHRKYPMQYISSVDI